MKTVRYKMADGHRVITQISQRIFDPVGTVELTKPLVAATPEAKAWDGLQQQIQAEHMRHQAERNVLSQAISAERSQLQGVQSGLRKQIADERTRLLGGGGEMVSQLLVDLEAQVTDEKSPLLIQLESQVIRVKSELMMRLESQIFAVRKNWVKMRSLILETNAAYFGLRRNEIQPANVDELESKFRSLGAGEALTTDGEIIADVRGQQYWAEEDGEFVKKRVEKIKEEPPKDAILLQDVKPEHRERIAREGEHRRIKGLSAVNRHAELTQALEGAAQRAAGQRSVYEIKGDAPEMALSKSQDLYKMLCDEIRAKYEN